MSDERQASERAKSIVANYELVACNLRRLGAGELADAEREVLDYIAALEADRARLDWLERAIPSLEFRAACDALPNKWPGTFREFVDAALSASSPLAPTQEGA